MKRSIALPDAPAVVAGHGRAAILTADGELLVLAAPEAAEQLRTMRPPFVIHAPATFRRLAMRPGPAFDLLELFAFVLPGRTLPRRPRAALPWRWTTTIRHRRMEAEAAMLPDLAATLLNRLALGRRHAR